MARRWRVLDRSLGKRANICARPRRVPDETADDEQHAHMATGESRTELLQWLNDLLQINYTKIEQCGSGAAYCQVLDSIYGAPPRRPLRARC